MLHQIAILYFKALVFPLSRSVVLESCANNLITRTPMGLIDLRALAYARIQSCPYPKSINMLPYEITFQKISKHPIQINISLCSNSSR